MNPLDLLVYGGGACLLAVCAGLLRLAAEPRLQQRLKRLMLCVLVVWVADLCAHQLPQALARFIYRAH